MHPKGLREGGHPLSVGVQEEGEPRMEKGLPPVRWRGLSTWGGIEEGGGWVILGQGLRALQGSAPLS